MACSALPKRNDLRKRLLRMAIKTLVARNGSKTGAVLLCESKRDHKRDNHLILSGEPPGRHFGLVFDALHCSLSPGIDLYPSVWTVDVGGH
jgi:hypothetical protein